MRILVSGCTRTMVKMCRRGETRMGLLVNPFGPRIPAADLPFVVDPRGFGLFREDTFEDHMKKIKEQEMEPHFVLAPDVQRDHVATAANFWEWYERIQVDNEWPIGIVAQDGATADNLPWDMIEAVFLDGTTQFKYSESTLELIDRAHERGKWLHMSGVNSTHLMRRAWELRFDSVDGSRVPGAVENHLARMLGWLDELEHSYPQING